MQLAVQGLVVVLRGAAEVVVIFVMVETGRRVEGMEAAVAAGTVAGDVNAPQAARGVPAPGDGDTALVNNKYSSSQ